MQRKLSLRRPEGNASPSPSPRASGWMRGERGARPETSTPCLLPRHLLCLFLCDLNTRPAFRVLETQRDKHDGMLAAAARL